MGLRLEVLFRSGHSGALVAREYMRRPTLSDEAARGAVPGTLRLLDSFNSRSSSNRLIREFLGCADQKRHEKRLAFLLAEAVEVLNGVPGPLARQLLQPAMMDGAPHSFIEPDGANGAQLLAEPKKIPWRRTGRRPGATIPALSIRYRQADPTDAAAPA